MVFTSYFLVKIVVFGVGTAVAVCYVLRVIDQECVFGYAVILWDRLRSLEFEYRRYLCAVEGIAFYGYVAKRGAKRV